MNLLIRNGTKSSFFKLPQSLSVVSLSNKWYVTFSIIGSTPVKQFISSVVPSESSPAVAVNFNVYTMARQYFYR